MRPSERAPRARATGRDRGLVVAGSATLAALLSVPLLGLGGAVAATDGPRLFPLVVLETGIPRGVAWGLQVDASNGSPVYRGAPDTARVAVSVPAGNYTVTATAPEGWTARGATLANVTVALRVSPVRFGFALEAGWRIVTFAERGLRAGTPWSFNLESTGGWSAAEVADPNGSYETTLAVVRLALPIGLVIQYTNVTSVAGTSAVDLAGGIVVNSSTARDRVPLVFAYVHYPIQFDETGLPASAEWSVTVAGHRVSSEAGNLTVSLPDGTYRAVVHGPPDYVDTPETFSVTVDGASAVYTVLFFSP